MEVLVPLGDVDNYRLLFGLLNLVYWYDQDWMQIRMYTISATNEETKGHVDAIEEQETVLNTF